MAELLNKTIFNITMINDTSSNVTNVTDTLEQSTETIDITGITLENAIAASIIFITAFTSLFINGAFGIFSATSKKLNPQLALLNIALSLCDFGGLSIFAFWTAPMTLLQSDWSTSFFGEKVGQLSMFFWFGGMNIMFVMSINRYVAIKYPLRYKDIFSLKVTKVVLTIVLIATCAETSIYFLPGCGIIYGADSYVWYYSDSFCGQVFSTIIQDLVCSTLFVAIILIFNLLTLVVIRSANKQVSGVRDADVEKRRSGEIRFFLQSLANTFFFDFCIVNFTLISRLTDTKWGWFWTTIIPWLMCHASNGYLALVFQQDMRMRLTDVLLCRTTVSKVSVTKMTKL